MAFFMNPGEIFLGCLGTYEQQFLIEVIKAAKANGYNRFVEPCAGTFAMSNLAVKSGFRPEQIETSDISMMSSILGYAMMERSLEDLEINAEGFDRKDLLDPAVALYAQVYLRMTKSAGNAYFFNLLNDLKCKKEKHIDSIRGKLEENKKIIGGISYRPLDMFAHMREVMDDEKAIIVINPPTYFAGYEKFYDTQGKMTWNEPEYELFDPKSGHFEMFQEFQDCNALILCYQEKNTGEVAGKTVYARAAARGDLNAYIATNKEDEVVRLAHGKKIKRKSEAKVEPLKCSVIPSNYRIKEDSNFQIIEIKSSNAQYYRRLWTHNFVGSMATFNRALIIDGMVAGVFGISKMSSDSLFIWYVMKSKSKYRLGRLIYLICKSKEFTNTLLNCVEKEKVNKVRTAMLTKYPENKEVRGIMKQIDRKKGKTTDFKLTYEAELIEETQEKIFKDWLRKDEKWLNSKAK